MTVGSAAAEVVAPPSALRLAPKRCKVLPRQGQHHRELCELVLLMKTERKR